MMPEGTATLPTQKPKVRFGRCDLLVEAMDLCSQRHLPHDLRRELAAVLGRHLARLLERKGVTEREIVGDFDAYRRRRR
jgi:hypothetical protein